jgi:deoxyribose-phosphate aldolase
LTPLDELASKLGLNKRRLATMIDATILAPTSTLKDAERLVRDVADYGFYCALLPPYSIGRLARLAGELGVRLCSVAGFPYGYSTSQSKVAEVERLASLGAVEIDAVVNVSAILSGSWDLVEEEVGALVDKARAYGARLKLIVEAPLLSDEALDRLAGIAYRARVDFLKTSTGVLSKGGDPWTVSRLVRVSRGLPVKAAGGIRTAYDALAAVAAGASRIGASSYKRIIETMTWEAR